MTTEEKLKQVTQELEETRTMLLHSEKLNAMGQLVASIVHEINNPVAFVNSNLHTLLTYFQELSDGCRGFEKHLIESNNSQSLEQIKIIRQQHDLDFIYEDFPDLGTSCVSGLERIRRIIDALRNFSRHSETTLTRCDLNKSIQNTLDLAYPAIKDNNIKVITDLAPLPEARCFMTELNQAFLNIIMNAIQAMQPGGTLSIQSSHKGSNIHLSFKDNGCGIAPDLINKIFKPFYTTKPPGQGTGLGLSLVHTLIAGKQQGSISVKSKENEGTVLTLIIPSVVIPC